VPKSSQKLQILRPSQQKMLKVVKFLPKLLMNILKKLYLLKNYYKNAKIIKMFATFVTLAITFALVCPIIQKP